MDGWLVLQPFQWYSSHIKPTEARGRLCALEPCLQLKRILPLAVFEVGFSMTFDLKFMKRAKVCTFHQQTVVRAPLKYSDSKTISLLSFLPH